jgi:hypothetical protein
MSNLMKIDFEKINIENEENFHPGSFSIRVKTNFSLGCLKKQFNVKNFEIENLENDFIFKNIDMIIFEPISDKSKEIINMIIDKENSAFQIIFDVNDFRLEIFD